MLAKRSAGRIGTAFAFAICVAAAQSPAPLRLEKTIALSGVAGRIDHMSFDTATQRLFVAALGNNAVEVADVRNAKVVGTIMGLAEPQGVLYQPEKKRLFVANGADGTVRIFDGLTLEPLRSIALGDDADNIRMDGARRVYVGYGSGAIAVLDADGNKEGEFKLDGHPESFQIEDHGQRMYVNVPQSGKISVIERGKSGAPGSWSTDDATANFPMALDEEGRRLFIVCRRPALLLVLDTKSGAVVQKLPTVGDSDDIFYDGKRRRLYASGGEGAIAVYQRQASGDYSEIARIETVKGARTSLFVPGLDRLFLAVRQEGQNPAAIWVYEAM